MATYTSNYGWTKPSGSDNVDISVLNNNLDDQDSTIHDAFLNMAPPFSESSTYAVDDIVLYGTGLYKCHTAVVTPGSWTGSTNWQVYKLSEGGSGGGGTTNYNALTNKPQINSVELSGNKTAAQLGLMASDGVVANPTGQTTGSLTALEVGGTKYAVGGGSGTSDYTDLTNKPSINGVTLLGNKTTSDLGITASGVGAIPSTDKGANGGIAELDANGKVPSSQLPSYVDDVLSYASQSAFPATGETGKIYIAEDTNKTYRWSGSAYAEISESLALGETQSTAYRGDRGKTAYDHSQTTGNPHGTTAADVGLGNVPNVSTNDQEPTFTEASTRNNIASGEKLSVIFGKIQKFFNDLKTVAFSGSFTDLTDKPSNANTFQGTIAEWNNLTTAEKKAYDHASITGTGGGEYNVNRTTGSLEQTAGIPSEYPASQVMLSDGVTSVEDALDANNLDTAVNITSYTTTKYVAPSDGYLELAATASQSTRIRATIYGADGTNSIALSVTYNQINSFNSVYVKKGMKIAITTNENNGVAFFVPIA